MKVYLILILYGFCICGFAHSLEFISNPQINICSAFEFILEHAQGSKNIESPDMLMHIPS